MSAAYSRGFTLVELVVAIAISGVVILFAAMFITAPVDAYEAQTRRANQLADVSTAWPRIEEDLRRALPNSVRTNVNGGFILLEMLETSGFARYVTPPAAAFTVAGTARGYFDTLQPGAGAGPSGIHLSMNNQGEEAYTQSQSMTPELDILTATPAGVAGHANLTLSAAPVFTGGLSPRNRIYLVRGFVAYLCDQGQGTLTRYSGTAIVANVNAHSAPANFAGGEVVARGLTTCAFNQIRRLNRPQEVQVDLTSTRNNETVSARHRATLGMP